MADNPFLAQLLGANVSPYESTYGQLSEAIGAATPRLVNPYASPGRNLASVAGAGLLAGLLGYQARREAEAENRAMMPQLTALLGAKSPTDIAALAGAENFPTKMMPLAQGLLLQQYENQTSAAEDKAKFERELQLQKEKNIGEFAAKYGLPEVLGIKGIPTSTTGLLTPADQEAKTARERQYQLDIYSKRTEEKQRIASNEVTKNYAALTDIQKSLEGIVGIDNMQAAQAAAKLLVKSIDPSSTITLPELASAEGQSFVDKLWGKFRAASDGKSNLSEDVKRNMLDIVTKLRTQKGLLYNNLVENAFANAAPFGIADKKKQLRPFDKFVDPIEAQQLAQVVANLERLKGMGKATPEMIAKVAEEIERVRGND